MNLSVSAPGKLILFGEHAVVYFKKAIATSLDDLRTSIHLTTTDQESGEPSLCFDSEQIGFSSFQIPVKKFIHLRSKLTVNHDQESFKSFVPKVNEEIVNELTTIIKQEYSGKGDARFVSMIGALYLYLYMCPSNDDGSTSTTSIDLKATTNMPIGAGLGSSASFSVCLSGAMLSAFQWIDPTQFKSDETLALINRWGYFVEELIHGTPSGIDNTVATFGGVVSFVKGQTPVKLDTIPGNLKLLIVDTTVPRDTKALVAGVRQRYEKDSQYEKYMDQIESCSNNCLSLFDQMKSKAIERERYITQFESLIDENQHLLESIGVGHPALSKVVSLSKEHGLHAKLTGAGGGGCSFVLLDDNEQNTQEFMSQLLNEGFKCYLSNVGHEGVIIQMD